MMIRGSKMVVFQSIYGHQIHWANVCDINLDLWTSGLLQNQSIDLLSTPTSHVYLYIGMDGKF